MSSSFRSSRAPAPYAGPSWQLAAVFLFAALLAQVSVLHFFAVRGAEISIVLVVVIWFAIFSDVRRAAVFGLAAGICEDALGTYTGGAWTIATALTAVIASIVSRNFFGDSIPLFAALVACGTLVRNTLFWMVMEAQGYPQGYGWLHFHTTLWQALVNACFAIVVMLANRVRENAAVR